MSGSPASSPRPAGREGADAVLQTSDDGWTCGTPLAALMDDRNAMLAVYMNGDPLTVEHGFPVRTLVPGLYGYVSACKWVVDMEVTSFDEIDAYWTTRGWSEEGPVKIASRIDVPDSGDNVSTGTLVCGGSAWKQHTGIELRGGLPRRRRVDAGDARTGPEQRHLGAVAGRDRGRARGTTISGCGRSGKDEDVQTGVESRRAARRCHRVALDRVLGVSVNRSSTGPADFAGLAGGALVIGGSGGIGRRVAEMLIERGARVAVDPPDPTVAGGRDVVRRRPR